MRNKFNDIFEELARTNDRGIIWSNWLDYCIDINLLNNDNPRHDFKGNEKEYAMMLNEWLQLLSETLEEKPYYDMLGLFYEELVTSHAKSKNIGQFFTPSEVTELMVEMSLIDNDNSQICNDCTCGSGRMLLSAHVQSKGDLICIGQDLDEMSCKMAVLNFWSHGVRGSIIHQDTLTGEFYNAWRVNNYLYYGIPIPHIEIVNKREAYNFLGMKHDKINENMESLTVNDKGTVQSKLL